MRARIAVPLLTAGAILAIALSYHASAIDGNPMTRPGSYSTPMNRRG
jgi:hypothetical protein